MSRLIDADALLEIIRTHRRDLWEDVWNFFDGKPHRSRDYLRGLENGYWEIKKDIEQLPTIDPVKRGKWIEVKDKWCGLEIRCSECGAHVPRDGWGNAMQCDYCPNCGARMMEGEERCEK